MWSWENSVFKTSSLPIFKSGHLSVNISICFCKCPVVFSNLKVWKAMFKKWVEALPCQINVSDLGYSTLFFEGQVLTARGRQKKVQQCFTG